MIVNRPRLTTIASALALWGLTAAPGCNDKPVDSAADEADVDAADVAPDAPPTDTSAPDVDHAVTVDDAYWSARQLGYLRFATQQQNPKSAANTIAHLARAEREADYEAPVDAVPADAWDGTFEMMADFEDTADFRALDLLNLVYGYHGHPMLSAALWDKIDAALLGFKFWYTQPTPEHLTDDMWYWSENHQAIFHTCEYLAGQRFEDEVFPTTGMTGAEHKAHARQMLLRWLDFRARFGFFEWHSNVYYPHDMKPLLSIVEWADNPELRTRAAMLLDLLIFDLALHNHRGAFGVTHGRTYKKDKMSAFDHNTFWLSKFLFDTTEVEYESYGDGVTTLMARAQRYRLPEVIRRVAVDTGPYVDRERMGIFIDEHEPLHADPVAPYGLSYDDEADLPIWWSMSALSVWQVVPLTFDVVERYNMWETDLFSSFAPLKDLITDDITLMQEFVQEYAHAASMGLLEEVNTYTYRTADYMLATAQDYRKGSRAYQQHIWTAILGLEAIVFTTHPGEPPRETTDWRSDGQPGQWTGTATIPRSAQHQNAAIHIYSVQYDELPAPLELFTAYEPYTHAYFPQDRFDEVVQDGHWTFGRYRDGYVALWSWREPEWVTLDPAVYATDGMTAPFILRAPGGPQNVWLVECGDKARWGDFAAFRAAVAAAAITVTEIADPLPASADRGPVFDVTYASPTVGTMALGWEGPLLVDGEVVPLGDYPRYDNPYSQTPFESAEVVIADPAGGAELRLDFDRWERAPALP